MRRRTGDKDGDCAHAVLDNLALAPFAFSADAVDVRAQQQEKERREADECERRHPLWPALDTGGGESAATRESSRSAARVGGNLGRRSSPRGIAES